MTLWGTSIEPEAYTLSQNASTSAANSMVNHFTQKPPEILLRNSLNFWQQAIVLPVMAKLGGNFVRGFSVENFSKLRWINLTMDLWWTLWWIICLTWNHLVGYLQVGPAAICRQVDHHPVMWNWQDGTFQIRPCTVYTCIGILKARL